MARKPNELYIFITSPRSDPYVNILVQASRQFALEKICFVGIAEHAYQAEAGSDAANATLIGALNTLHSLTAGTYRGDHEVEALENTSTLIYQQCLERLKYIDVSARGIRWTELDITLERFNETGTAIFDVTALKKNLLVDVVALLLSQGEPQIWTFELIKKPSYGKDDLIHAMADGKDFKYKCITDGKHIETATRRMLARSLTWRSLMILTTAILVPIVLVEIFLPESWIQSALVGIGTAVSIASWFLVMKRR